jgi:pyruvate formate lyase activating enzyme
LILRNLQILRNSGKDFVLRTPLIPNITDTKENLDAIKKIVGNDKWERLEYNTLTPAKYARIGKEYLL